MHLELSGRRSQEFESIPLAVEKLYAVLPKQHVLAKRPAVSLAELQGDPFPLLRDGHCFRETAVAACKRARLNPQIVFEGGQFSIILSMVSAGLGVSVVPAMAVEKRAGCCYIPLADERAGRTIGAVTLKGKSLSRANDAFLAHLGVRSLRKRGYDLTPGEATSQGKPTTRNAHVRDA